MIKIDMEMPRTCGECILGKKITSQYFACQVLGKEIPTGHKSPNCPLHPLDDDEIRVGDEIYLVNDESIKGVVIEQLLNDSWTVFTENGCTEFLDEKEIRRTGRHFDEIKTILQKMRDEEDA